MDNDKDEIDVSVEGGTSFVIDKPVISAVELVGSELFLYVTYNLPPIAALLFNVLKGVCSSTTMSTCVWSTLTDTRPKACIVIIALW